MEWQPPSDQKINHHNKKVKHERRKDEMENTTIARKEQNTEKNGIEIYFAVYPLNGTRETLKNNGFRWNYKKGCWYAKQSMTTESIADTCADTTIEEYKRIALSTGEKVTEIKTKATATQDKTKKATKTKKAVNKYGIEKGAFFSMSWGYEQTNVTYFQVVELVGTCSARVKEVYPEIIERTPTCSMAEDRVYNLDRSKLAPCASSSVFINDCEHGDLKKITPTKWSKEEQYHISFDHGYYTAHLVTTNTEKQYCSWYY